MLCSDGRWSSITWDDRFDGFGGGSCAVSLDLTPRGGRVMEASFSVRLLVLVSNYQYRDQRTQEPTPTASRGRNFCGMPARAAAGRASDFLVWVRPIRSVTLPGRIRCSMSAFLHATTAPVQQRHSQWPPWRRRRSSLRTCNRGSASLGPFGRLGGRGTDTDTRRKIIPNI
jgi:hypothetical protein